MSEIWGMLLPADLRPEDFAVLTEKRQKLLIALLKEELTLSRLVEKGNIDLSYSSASEALDILSNRKLVKKNINKVYSLTIKGKLLTLFLLKPNGTSESEIRHLLDDVLEKDFKLEDIEYRNDIIETFRRIGEDIRYKA